MKKIWLSAVISMAFILILPAQAHRTPPDFTISINPTEIMSSWYDYMIGGYNSSPVKTIPDIYGGGFLMAFHAKEESASNRYSYLARINSQGELQSTATLAMNGTYNGYPSLDLDEESGVGFIAWHNQLAGNSNTSVYGAIVMPGDGPDNYIGSPLPVFESSSPGETYYWPVVKCGASPILGMRRIYVMARKPVTAVYPAEVPKIAYADYNPLQVNPDTDLIWNYISVPEVEGWAAHTTLWRRVNYTIMVGPDAALYLCGRHSAMDASTDEEIFEPNLDIFILEGINPDTWRRISVSAEQSPSCQPYDGFDIYTNLSNCGHFNAVMDPEGNILFPQLSTFHAYDDGVLYYYPVLHAMRNIVFDTLEETFRIDDLWPQGASPHSEPCYTPWDIDEDGMIDEIDDQGNAVFPTLWPFPYWDMSAHSNAMMFHYNLQMLTRPNELGWMACVWQDSNRARLNFDTFPTNEICISLSPDNGWTWLEPVKLNSVETPQLAGIKPMWVYPASGIVQVNHTTTEEVGRLYLMFYDDASWGAYVLTPPVGTLGVGQVRYMAVDFILPVTEAADPTSLTPQIVLQQNFPNPFSTETNISYRLKGDGYCRLDIYNIKGQTVKILAQGIAKAGDCSLVWNGEDESGNKAASGIYFCRLQSAGTSVSRKLLLLRK
jgi:hypothetical protein